MILYICQLNLSGACLDNSPYSGVCIEDSVMIDPAKPLKSNVLCGEKKRKRIETNC